MYTTGFLFLHALPGSRQLNAQERLFLSPIFFFVYILVIFFANWALHGQLLSSRPLLITFFVISLPTLYWAGRKTIIDTEFFLHQKWQLIAGQLFFSEHSTTGNDPCPAKYKFLIFFLILLAATLVSCGPLLLGERFDVDALDHLMWTNQFLNGRIFSSTIPYAGHGLPKEMYPFIIHITAAFFARLLQVQAETGIIVTTVIQALLYPLGLYFLILKITSNYRIALLAMVTGCFYFGHGYLLGIWWFNIPVQRLDMANNVCRMMSMAIAPFILYLFILTLHEKNEKPWKLTGLLTGIAGLIHPYFFSYVITFSVISVLYFSIRKDWRLAGHFSGILFISLMLFSVILIPDILSSIGNNISFDQLTVIPEKFKNGSLSQVVITPYEYLVSYGLVGILALFSLFTWKRVQYKSFINLLSLTILLLIAITWIKEVLFVRFNVAVPYNPAQHKYGNTLFLVCIILTSIFVRYVPAKTHHSKIWGPRFISILLVVPTLTTIPNLIAFERYFIQRDPFFSQYRNPDNIYHLIKTRLRPDAILAVPDWWTCKFASFTGHDLLYINESNYYTPYRRLANILLFLPVGKKQSAIAEESGIKYEELVKHILEYFEIEDVIVPQQLSNTYKGYSFANYLARGTTHLPAKKKIGFDIYQIKRSNTTLQHSKSIVEKILTNENIFQIAAGGIPLVTEEYIRLRIYNQRRRNFISLTSINNKIFAINSTDEEVYEINPANGQIIKRIYLPGKPSSIAGFENELYIYFRKDKSLRKIDINRKGKLRNLGTLAVPVGKIGDIAFDKEGKLWFFVWSGRQKQYVLYSYNQSTRQTVQEGKLPRKRIYTGLTFEKTRGTMLISTKRGFYFRWSPEEQKIITRYYNGRIRPFGICMIDSSLYAYNGLNHLIGKLKSMDKQKKTF